MATPLFRVKAVYDYNSPHDDDLSFPNGQIITVVEEEDADWYVGQYTDASGVKQEGLFPRNFVERIEPEAPPRPQRTRTKRESTTNIQAPAEVHEAAPEPSVVAVPVQTAPVQAAPPPAPIPVAVEPAPVHVNKSAPESKPEPTEPTPVAKAAPEPAPVAKAAPPVAEKPSSFKDRIAAFNKSSQAPLTPVKPLAAPGGFIKKPFVAPPPSRNSYVPPPREAVQPQKLYRREEDPEIAKQQAQDHDNAERAGLLVNQSTEVADDAPKTTLKERIALLQQQQQEQAARRTELSTKEKPNRPVQQRSVSSDTTNTVLSRESDDHDHDISAYAGQRTSVDSTRDATRAHPVRRTSRDPRSPDLPARELTSDGNEADMSGAGLSERPEVVKRESEEHVDRVNPNPHQLSRQSTATNQPMPQTVEESEGDEEEDEIDAETRRRMELRQRMAKMSGGMGMAGMFGGGMPMPGGAPKKPQAIDTSERRAESESSAAPASPIIVQRIPMVPLPPVHQAPEHRTEGRPSVEREPEPIQQIFSERDPDEVPDVEDLRPMPAVPQHRELQGQQLPSQERAVPPPPPGAEQRPVPPPPGAARPMPAPPVSMERSMPSQQQSRAVPPPPVQRELMSPGVGSRSDDEDSLHQEPTSQHPSPPQHNSATSTTGLPSLGPDLPIRGAPPPIPITSGLPIRHEGPRSPVSPSGKRMSYFANSPTSPIASSPPAVLERRISRGPPPIPLASPTMSPPSEMTRLPPPPPPPTAVPPQMRPAPIQESNSDDGDDRESDYEGDVDTDRAPIDVHRDLHRTYTRDGGMHENSSPQESFARPPVQGPPSLPPPIPNVQRDVPPLPTHHQVPLGNARQSMEGPRAPPPAPPPQNYNVVEQDEYDPYSYTGPVHGLPVQSPGVAPPPPQRTVQEVQPGAYVGLPPQRIIDRAPLLPLQGPPQGPPPSGPPPLLAMVPSQPPPQRTSRDLGRQSIEMPPTVVAVPKRSIDNPRPPTNQGHIAQDVDLAFASKWWAQSNTPPPVFQKRSDILYEIEESTTSKRGGRTTVSKDVYVLFADYSQTVITARFDAKDTADAHLEQRHEPPPRSLRQEQLENAHRRFGNSIHNAVAAKHNGTLGDGSPNAMILEVLRSTPMALLPVGTRAYGALVYVNMANSSVQQHDQIRPGDIITFRNAKFQGKHGAMHAKYSMDVGRPEHVAIVSEWEGSKKKVRAWEQGRDNRKVKLESFKMGDLSSGEVRVWRVMGRDWVGWEGEN